MEKRLNVWHVNTYTDKKTQSKAFGGCVQHDPSPIATGYKNKTMLAAKLCEL